MVRSKSAPCLSHGQCDSVIGWNVMRDWSYDMVITPRFSLCMMLCRSLCMVSMDVCTFLRLRSLHGMDALCWTLCAWSVVRVACCFAPAMVRVDHCFSCSTEWLSTVTEWTEHSIGERQGLFADCALPEMVMWAIWSWNLTSPSVGS